jgi:hypothetical protein
MRARVHIIAAVAAAATLNAALPRPAHAQFWPPLTDKDKKGRFHVGRLALTPRLELRNAGVDTNVFVTPTDPTRDTAIVLRASSDAYLPVGRRVRLAGGGWVDFNYFASEDDQGSTDPGAQGRVEVDAWRLTFIGGGGGFHARQLYSIDIDQRIRRSEGFANGGVRLRLSTELSAEAGVERRAFRWYPTADQIAAGTGESVRELLDRDSTTWKGGLRYRVTTLTDLVGSVEKIDDTFLFATPGLETTTSYRTLAGFEFGERAFLTGRLLAGVRTIPAGSAGSVVPYTGPAVQTAVVAPFLQRLRLTLSYDRDVYYSAEGGRVAADVASRNTFTYDRLAASLDVDTALDLVLRFNAGYERAHYLRPYPYADLVVDRTDQVRILGVSLLRRIGENALLGISAVHTRRASNYPGGEYSRWQYGISGSVSP